MNIPLVVQPGHRQVLRQFICLDKLICVFVLNRLSEDQVLAFGDKFRRSAEERMRDDLVVCEQRVHLPADVSGSQDAVADDPAGPQGHEGFGGLVVDPQR